MEVVPINRRHAVFFIFIAILLANNFNVGQATPDAWSLLGEQADRLSSLVSNGTEILNQSAQGAIERFGNATQEVQEDIKKEVQENIKDVATKQLNEKINTTIANTVGNETVENHYVANGTAWISKNTVNVLF